MKMSFIKANKSMILDLKEFTLFWKKQQSLNNGMKEKIMKGKNKENKQFLGECRPHPENEHSKRCPSIFLS